MKFDPERAMTMADRFAFPRSLGTEGERRAAEMVKEELEHAGLLVEHGSFRPPFRGCISIIMLPMLWFLTWVWLGHISSGIRLGLSIAATAAMIGIGGHRFRRLVSRSNDTTEQVIGRFPVTDGGASVRVVLATCLTTRSRRWAAIEKRLSSPVGQLIGMPVLFSIMMWGGLSFSRLGDDVPWATDLRTWLVACAWIACFLLVALPADRLIRPSIAHDQTGLATLIELARTWPRRSNESIDVRFVATSDVGAANVATRACRDWPALPTLVVCLDAPALGPTLGLAGSRDGLRLARGAAGDLWLPHKAASHLWDRGSSLTQSLASLGSSAIEIRGDRRVATVERGVLAAVAQLATELALRWARQNS